MRFPLRRVTDHDTVTIGVPGSWSDTQLGESYGAFVAVEATSDGTRTWTITIDDVVVLAVTLHARDMTALDAFAEVTVGVADFGDHRTADPAGTDIVVGASSSDYFRTLRNTLDETPR